MPGAAAMLRPLTDALRGSPLPKMAVEWTVESVQGRQSSPREGDQLGLPQDGSGPGINGGRLRGPRGGGPPTVNWTLRRGGNPWVSSPRNWTRPNSTTQPTTGSYWLACWGSGTSGSCWKGSHSPSTQTIKP